MASRTPSRPWPGWGPLAVVSLASSVHIAAVCSATCGSWPIGLVFPVARRPVWKPWTDAAPVVGGLPCSLPVSPALRATWGRSLVFASASRRQAAATVLGLARATGRGRSAGLASFANSDLIHLVAWASVPSARMPDLNLFLPLCLSREFAVSIAGWAMHLLRWDDASSLSDDIWVIERPRWPFPVVADRPRQPARPRPPLTTASLTFVAWSFNLCHCCARSHSR